MPHECTDCGRTFADGSKEMLSGCPDCGGNKFQFHPDDTDDPPETEEPPEPPEPAVNSSVARTVGNAATAVRDLVGGDSESELAFDARDAGRADATAAESRSPGRDPKSTSPDTGSTSPDTGSGTPDPRIDDSTTSTGASEPSSESSITGSTATRENSAQASARSEIVSADDLPSGADQPTRSRPAPVMDDTDESERSERERDRPDISELREQLNEQFESIRVLAPGQYELNLMELYDREEYIIALQEDGKYTIQVPERWNE